MHEEMIRRVVQSEIQPVRACLWLISAINVLLLAFVLTARAAEPDRHEVYRLMATSDFGEDYAVRAP